MLRGLRVSWRPESCQENFLSYTVCSMLDLYTVKWSFDYLLDINAISWGCGNEKKNVYH